MEKIRRIMLENGMTSDVRTPNTQKSTTEKYLKDNRKSNLIDRRFRAIPHNSKRRYGERGAAVAKPKAQIILDVLSSILATQMPCRSRRSGA